MKHETEPEWGQANELREVDRNDSIRLTYDSS